MLHQHERRRIDNRCTGRHLERNTPSINIGDHDLPALAAPTTDLFLADPTKPVTLCGETLLQTGPIRVIQIDVLDFRRGDILDENHTGPRTLAGSTKT